MGTIEVRILTQVDAALLVDAASLEQAAVVFSYARCSSRA